MLLLASSVIFVLLGLFAAASVHLFFGSMKLQRQLSMGKLSTAVRDLIVGSVIVAKCRELWEGLTTVAAPRPAEDDYFKGSYEFSCTTTPLNVLTLNGRRRRQRRLPPCVGAKQATEMLAGSVVKRGRGGWSPPEPDRSPHQAMAALDIDGLAEEFIERFREQLRMQVEVEEEPSRPRPKSRLACSVPAM